MLGRSVSLPLIVIKGGNQRSLGMQTDVLMHRQGLRSSSTLVGTQLGHRTAIGSLRSVSAAKRNASRSSAPRRDFPVAQSSSSPIGEVSGMESELKQAVEEFLEKNKVVLFMKGTKQFPQCGFSNTCVQILNMMKVPYETINILEDERLRQGMKAYSQWPTFPQVYINSEFVGGCDIMIEAYQNGELQEMLEVGINS